MHDRLRAFRPTLPGSRLAAPSLPAPASATGLRVAHLGTYPPRRCGIATYTQDVVEALRRYTPAAPPVVVAMEAPGDEMSYCAPVEHTISQNDPAMYREVARLLNTADVDLLSIQYEHGIFGGEDGAMLSELLDSLTIPAVATLHTVLPEPSPSQVRAVRALWKRCQSLVVLNGRALPLLEKGYGIPSERVAIIPHGTPEVDPKRRSKVREALGLKGRKAIATFGLLGPGKGLEHAVDAVARIAERHPDTDYYILGATHPGIVRNEGERYREGLMTRASEQGIADRIKFVNRYLSLDEICDWLLACDIYVTPYLNPNQIVSGTLAYAVAAGCPVVSTPYLHAQELLARGRGVLSPFSDPEALAENLDRLLSSEELRESLRTSARAYGAGTSWRHTAAKYTRLFDSVLPRRASETRAAVTPAMTNSSPIAAV